MIYLNTLLAEAKLKLSIPSDIKKLYKLFKKNRKQLYINPEECIDCGACEPECPVEAIFVEEDVPPEWDKFIDKNYEFFGQKRD